MNAYSPFAHLQSSRSGESTWLKVFPLYTPMTDPIISGTMIMFRRCVLTGSGFSPETASLLAFLSFLMSARGLRFSPLWNLLTIPTTNQSQDRKDLLP